jgi:hypothetical protein
VHRGARQILAKALVILKCNKTYENTELSPWNAKAHSPPQIREPGVWKNPHAAAVRCSASFGPIVHGISVH